MEIIIISTSYFIFVRDWYDSNFYNKDKYGIANSELGSKKNLSVSGWIAQSLKIKKKTYNINHG